MSVDATDSLSVDQLIVTVEQATVLLDMMSTSKGTTRVSSDALTSGLVSGGLVGVNGLVGDAQRILGPASDARTRAAIRVVSPAMPDVVRDWRIWPTVPRSVIMRSDVDGVHFSQVDFCEVPHILAFASLLYAGPTLHDGPPYIPTDFVRAIRMAPPSRTLRVTVSPGAGVSLPACVRRSVVESGTRARTLSAL